MATEEDDDVDSGWEVAEDPAPPAPARSSQAAPGRAEMVRSPREAAKPASKAPPPKLAVGPRPSDAKMGAVQRPVAAMLDASVPPSTVKVPLPDAPPSMLGPDLALGFDAPPTKDASAPRSGFASGARNATPVSGLPAERGSTDSFAPGPRSRSFTPRVDNAVAQAKELDVRASEELDLSLDDIGLPSDLTPPGTNVVTAALAAGKGSVRDMRGTPLRMPTISSREAGEAPRPTPEARPATTSLRFAEQQKTKPIPRDRKVTVQMTRAAQDLTIQLLGRDDPSEHEARAGALRPKLGRGAPSAPLLDLHLPDDLAVPSSTRSSPPGDDDGPMIEVADDGLTSDAIDDLPIDEVLEAVRQSSMPAEADGDGDPMARVAPPPPRTPRVGDGDLDLDALEAPMRDLGSLAPERDSDGPRISDLPLAGLAADETPLVSISRASAPVSDMPPTVRGSPPDELRFPNARPTPKERDAITVERNASNVLPPRKLGLLRENVKTRDSGLDAIRERFERGDFAGALLRAEALLEANPEHGGAQEYVRNCQAKVKEMYISRLGSSDSVLYVVMSRERIQDLAFDHRGGFLISLIDGVATVDDVLDISGMPPLEALRLLYELKQEGVIDSTPPGAE